MKVSFHDFSMSPTYSTSSLAPCDEATHGAKDDAKLRFELMNSFIEQYFVAHH